MRIGLMNTDVTDRFDDCCGSLVAKVIFYALPMWPVGFDAVAFGANMDGAVKCGDLLKFLCMLH